MAIHRRPCLPAATNRHSALAEEANWVSTKMCFSPSVRPSSSFFFFLLAVGLGEIRALDCTDRSSRSRPLSKVSFLFLAGLHTFISLRVESACVCVDKASIGGHDHVPVPSEKRGIHTKKSRRSPLSPTTGSSSSIEANIACPEFFFCLCFAI